MTITPVTLRTWGIGHARTLDDWTALAQRFLSSDLKCSPVAGTSADGTPRASDSVRMATWLPSGPPSQGGTCPGASDYCHAPDGKLVCYSDRLERSRPSLGRLVGDRLDVWNGLSQGEKVTLCAAIIAEAYRAQAEPSPLSSHAGHPVAAPILRIGAGGDLDTSSTGQAWADALHWAADRYPTLRAWIYSRSYELGRAPVLPIDDPLGPIADGIADGRLPNVSAYLSSDPSMIDRTRRALAGRYSHLPVAMLADTREQALGLLGDLERGGRPVVCPTERETHQWPLAMRRPTENHARGACDRCRACITPAGSHTVTPDIIFIRR
jgi:hypothetical protein